MNAPSSRIVLKGPWLDASGRFSVLRTAVLVGLCLPAAWLASEFWSGRWDFPSPFVPLIYHSGLWATYLLLLSLFVTPLCRIAGWTRLAQTRRMIGLAALLYTLLHLLAWFGLRFWDAGVLLLELVDRPTLWAATISLVGLMALGATSFDAAIRRMGPRAWKRLHRAVYWLAGLAVLHFLLSPGALQGLPFLMAGAYVWLMGWRLLERRRRGASPPALAALALLATLFTLLLEPAWLATVQAERAYHGPLDALAANFNTENWVYLGVPPAWQILGAGLALAAIRFLADRLPKSARRDPA